MYDILALELPVETLIKHHDEYILTYYSCKYISKIKESNKVVILFENRILIQFIVENYISDGQRIFLRTSALVMSIYVNHSQKQLPGVYRVGH